MGNIRGHVLADGPLDTIEANQAPTVSDQTAQIAKIGTGSGAGPKKGFIWIGDFGAGRWDRAELASLETGQPVTGTPD